MQLPFRRQSTTKEEVPTEIKQYYASEQRERTGATWLMSVGVFIVTVLVVLGLFYGGRALYRAVFENNDTSTTQEQSADQNSESSSTGEESISGDQEVPADDSGTSSDSTDNGDSNDTAENDAADDAPTETPATGPTDVEEIPRTGPEFPL